MYFEIGLDNIEDSNGFLKKLWFVFSEEFGELTWKHKPYKEGANNKIHFGQLNLNELVVSVSISYQKRGSIKGIYIESSNKKEISKENLDKIYGCINKATSDIEKSIFCVETVLKSYEKFIKYTTENFVIEPLNSTGKSRVQFLIESYDEKQAHLEVVEKMNILIALLSVDTNEIFTHRIKYNDSPNYEVYEIEEHDELYPWSIKEKLEVRPKMKVNDVDYLLISEDIFKFINQLLDKKLKIPNSVNNIFLSCEHFSNGLKMYENHLDTQVIESKGPSLKGRFEELALTSFLSALEVLTLKNQNDRCRECNQPKYSIKRKVVDKIKEHFPSDNLHEKIASYYDIRSSFLHTGKLSVDVSSFGYTIPQLSLNDKTGCKRNFSNIDLNLLRNVTRKVLLIEISKQEEIFDEILGS